MYFIVRIARIIDGSSKTIVCIFAMQNENNTAAVVTVYLISQCIAAKESKPFSQTG